MLALVLAARACLPMQGDRIRIGDLAAAIPAFRQLDEAEPVGFGPAPGSRRRFSSAELEGLATRKGITLSAEPLCFEREMESTDAVRVAEALRAALPDGAHLELLDFSRAKIPKGLLEFLPSGLIPPTAGRSREAMVWRGRVKYGETLSVPFWAKARVWLARPSLIAAGNLEVGRPIAADQVRMETVETSPFSRVEPLLPAGAVGLTPRRRIPAGQTIERSLLEAPAQVMRGDIVAVEVHYGAASLQLEARAESAGRIGDRILVRNRDSGKSFRVRVIGKGIVKVEAGQQ